jgi:hypothetical protein
VAYGQDDKPTAVGFAGLSSLVSDVDGLIAKVTTRANAQSAGKRADIAATANRPGLEGQGFAGRAQRAAGSPRRTIRWLLGTAAAVIVLWLIVIASDQSSSKVPSAGPPVPTGGTGLTVASPQPGAAVSSSQPGEAAGIVVPSATGSQEVSQAPPDPSSEQVPPVGTGIALSASQVRYCLAEKIRLEAARDIVEAESVVDQFNAMVDDYNGRCGNYRYSAEVFESLQQSVEANKATLQAEGIARVRR